MTNILIRIRNQIIKLSHWLDSYGGDFPTIMKMWIIYLFVFKVITWIIMRSIIIFVIIDIFLFITMIILTNICSMYYNEKTTEEKFVEEL